MRWLLLIINIIASCNSSLLALGRQVAWLALVFMVLVILLQVVFRYIFNNALPWPDEAARFLMLWMTGLIAPLAYRQGGFVAIDSLHIRLPNLLGNVLSLTLFIISAIVITYAIGIGWDHTFGFGGQFNSSSLKLPLNLIGSDSVPIKLRYMYGSLLLGMILLLFVNFELILRSVANILGLENKLTQINNIGKDEASE